MPWTQSDVGGEQGAQSEKALLQLPQKGEFQLWSQAFPFTGSLGDWRIFRDIPII